MIILNLSYAMQSFDTHWSICHCYRKKTVNCLFNYVHEFSIDHKNALAPQIVSVFLVGCSLFPPRLIWVNSAAIFISTIIQALDRYIIKWKNKISTSSLFGPYYVTVVQCSNLNKFMVLCTMSYSIALWCSFDDSIFNFEKSDSSICCWCIE